MGCFFEYVLSCEVTHVALVPMYIQWHAACPKSVEEILKMVLEGFCCCCCFLFFCFLFFLFFVHGG